MKYFDLKAKLPVYTLALSVFMLALTQFIGTESESVAPKETLVNSDAKAITQVLIEFANENTRIKNDLASLSQELAELKSCLAAQQNMGVGVIC
jgi:hypothetical protein